LPARPDVSEQGRKMALRVGAAFIVLMAVNVGIGLWLIARHETKNPNRALLERQMREQIANSLEHAAATFTPAPLGIGEITVSAPTGKLEVIGDEVVTIATRLGGSATKGLPDQGRLSVLLALHQSRKHFEWPTRSVEVTLARPSKGINILDAHPRLREYRSCRDRASVRCT